VPALTAVKIDQVAIVTCTKRNPPLRTSEHTLQIFLQCLSNLPVDIICCQIQKLLKW